MNRWWLQCPWRRVPPVPWCSRQGRVHLVHRGDQVEADWPNPRLEVPCVCPDVGGLPLLQALHGAQGENRNFILVYPCWVILPGSWRMLCNVLRLLKHLVRTWAESRTPCSLAVLLQYYFKFCELKNLCKISFCDTVCRTVMLENNYLLVMHFFIEFFCVPYCKIN